MSIQNNGPWQKVFALRRLFKQHVSFNPAFVCIVFFFLQYSFGDMEEGPFSYALQRLDYDSEKMVDGEQFGHCGDYAEVLDPVLVR
jgi:hypothetical protein